MAPRAETAVWLTRQEAQLVVHGLDAALAGGLTSSADVAAVRALMQRLVPALRGEACAEDGAPQRQLGEGKGESIDERRHL